MEQRDSGFSVRHSILIYTVLAKDRRCHIYMHKLTQSLTCLFLAQPIQCLQKDES